MRRFLTLVSREFRDARWNLVMAFGIAAVAPWVLHLVILEVAADQLTASAGGRVLVPLLFALFAAATASDLVARDVATRRIDALAALPVPVGELWRAKAAFLLVTSIVFLAWTIGMEYVAITATARAEAITLFGERLADAVPLLLGGAAIGAATLFFSTLLERGFTAVMAALVTVTALAWGIHVAEVPAADDATTWFATYAVPLGIALAFAAGSYAAFVRGPIHGPSKVRLFAAGAVAVVALVTPGSAAVALTLDAGTHLAPGDGDPALLEAYASPDGKWVAVQDGRAREASRTWIVGIDDASCRAIAPGATWFEGGAWLGGSMLAVRASTFSVLDGPRHLRRLEIEPTRLGVADERWVKRNEPTSTESWSSRWAWVGDRRTSGDGRQIVDVGWHGGSRRIACRDVVPSPINGILFVISGSGALTRLSVRDESSVELVHDGVKGAMVGPWEGLLLFVETTSGMRIHDANTGETLLDAPGRSTRFPSQIGRGRRVLLSTSDTAGRVASFTARDLTTGAVVDFGAPRLTDRVPRVTWLEDGRFLVVDGDVTLRDAAGRTIRRLFPPDSKEN